MMDEREQTIQNIQQGGSNTGGAEGGLINLAANVEEGSAERSAVLADLQSGSGEHPDVEANEPGEHQESPLEGEGYQTSGDLLGNDPDSYAGGDYKKES